MPEEIDFIYMDAVGFLADHPELELSPDNEGDLEMPEESEKLV